MNQKTLTKCLKTIWGAHHFVHIFQRCSRHRGGSQHLTRKGCKDDAKSLLGRGIALLELHPAAR